jgi:hypothetical protein
VQPAEQAERHVPVPVADQPADERVVGEPAAEIGVERRAAVAVTRLLEERLRLPQAALAFSSAAFACSATSVNAAGSLTASSASDFRSSSISALCSPAMNWL